MGSILADDFTWHKWLNGDCPPVVQIGLLSYECRNLIGAKSVVVWAAYPYIQKITFKHEMGPKDAMFIKEAMDCGHIFRISKQPTAVQFHVKAESTFTLRRYKLVLKLTNYDEQVWLRTFFRTD